jgi:F-box protein 9
MEDNAELESFRNQWKEEVRARVRSGSTSKQKKEPSTATSASGPSSVPPVRSPVTDRKREDYDDDRPSSVGVDQGIVEKTASLSLNNADDDAFQKEPQTEPESALEHFEKAVEKEEQGNLGDSLNLYRKAYRVNFLQIYN